MAEAVPNLDSAKNHTTTTLFHKIQLVSIYEKHCRIENQGRIAMGNPGVETSIR
jgi:hypothetical protein